LRQFTPVLTKLSPPRLTRAVDRERLYAWLDARRSDAAGLWLCGAPGAGKTTLTAGYTQARALPHLWYRFDADDNDVGRFFATLGAALDAVGPRTRRPRFAAENLANAPMFARRWFTVALAALPRPFAIVFDNVEQGALDGFAELVAALLETAPPGVCLIVTGREEPAPALARAVVQGQLAVLPADALAFTREEADAMARDLALDPARVASAFRRSGGWAAGLRLLSDLNGPAVDPLGPGAPAHLFAYFAGLVHQGLDEITRHLLQVAALLPWIPADVLAAVTGEPQARALLDRLCDRHLFIEPVARIAGAYRLHPLLREFLRERGRDTFDAADRRALQRHAALAFAHRGDADAALDLALDAGALDLAVPWLLNCLEAKLEAGQPEQWAAWAARLPEEAVRHEPALGLGLARIAFLREDGTALAHYETACGAYAARGDLAGQQLCAAGVLEWSYNTDSFVGHARWSALLRRAAPPAEDAQTALRLLNGRVLACFYTGDFESERERLMAEASAAFEGPGAANEKLSVAISLLGCLERRKRWDDAQWLAGRIEALLESTQVGPRLKILARQQIASDLHRQSGAYDEAQRLCLVAREQAREQGFDVLEYEAVGILALCALYTGDEVFARRLLADLTAISRPDNIYHQRFLHQMQGWHALQRGHESAARSHALALRAAVARSDMPARFRATWLQVAFYTDYLHADADAACEELRSAVADAEAGSREILQANLDALQAHRALRAGDVDAAAAALARAWAAAAAMRYFQLLGPLRAVLAELAALALERGIEAGFARELVERRRLAAPSPAAEGWPWRLRVFTLGRFAVEVQGRALVFEGKVPKKPLAVLKALIALSGQMGEGVPERALADALWPDDEADAALAALDVALHRMRKLLGAAGELLRVREGRVGLDARECWCDLRAFERMATRRDSPQAMQRALALYQGHFLAPEEEVWSVSARERARARFSSLVLDCADALAHEGRHDEALACCKRGLEVDDLDERLHQGAMRAALALGRPAEGIAAYQRCRRVLGKVLGTQPSQDTERLLRALLSLGS
jgi:LuxR family maltose regulon positive regulatory protein